MTVEEGSIHAITVPKWGMTMEGGQVTTWHVEEGGPVTAGQEVLDIETSKIAGSVEAKVSGVLRRQVARPGQALPVGALLGVVADLSVPDAAVDEFVAGFVTESVDETAESGGPATKSVELAGGKLNYTVQGEGGETVVLVHGFGGDLNNWLFNTAALAAEHTVYALDLPGHGASAKSLDDASMDSLAAAVAEFVSKVVSDRVHLVGHSLGGGICQLVAQRQPDLVASLTLIAPVGLGPEIHGGYLQAFIAAKNRRELKAAVTELFHDQSVVTGRMVDDILRYKRILGVEQALGRLAAANFPQGGQALLLAPGTEALGIPVGLIWGREDKIVPASHAAALPSARLLLLDGAGHMPMMEQAKAVNEAILGWIGPARSVS